jgi:hypothetical protein
MDGDETVLRGNIHIARFSSPDYAREQPRKNFPQENSPAGFSGEKPNGAGASQGYANDCGVFATLRGESQADEEGKPGNKVAGLNINISILRGLRGKNCLFSGLDFCLRKMYYSGLCFGPELRVKRA